LGPAFAFIAACAFALGTVLQQKGTLGTTSGSGDSHWLIQILHEPVWLAGLLLQAAGWVLQAVALAKGPLMVVQAITTLNLVIALPFGAWLTHQHIDRRVVLGALAAVVGIVVFLSVGSPHGGTTHPSARTWWITCLVTLVLVLATVPLFAAILRIPFTIIGPVIIAVCVIGAYTVANATFDLALMLGFGVLGYLLKKLDYPIAPLVLAMVLGDKAEDAFRQSLIMSHGSLSIFWSNGLVATMMALAILLALWPGISALRRRLFGPSKSIASIRP